MRRESNVPISRTVNCRLATVFFEEVLGGASVRAGAFGCVADELLRFGNAAARGRACGLAVVREERENANSFLSRLASSFGVDRPCLRRDGLKLAQVEVGEEGGYVLELKGVSVAGCMASLEPLGVMTTLVPKTAYEIVMVAMRR